ncbi:acyl-CoA dehydrogenase family protein [Altererythrobacter sp. GH1-8]|uniref:acyl-CoA dehydrogenase family protein n=1 Tax=Altererythrobacter sp. GH1-8 TaxID=3349333 RepID=UPI00374D415F
MQFAEILEPFERMLADTFPPACIRALEKGGDWQPAWAAVEQSGFLNALVAEDRGGFGLGWDAAGTLFMALGRHAVPLPVGESVVLRGLLAAQGDTIPEGPLQPAGAPETLDALWRGGAVGTPVTLASGETRVQLALVYAAQIAGAAERVLEMSIAYANERVQFGKPIGRQQAVQQQLAVMAEEMIAVRLSVELACSAGEPDLLCTASAKSIASRYAASIAATAHAVHGAIGISAEYDLQLYTRRMQTWRLACGGESHWDAVIGEAALASNDTVLDWVRRRLHR